MINLCGIGLSNYYNKIKLIMLEKGIAFTEEAVRPSQDEALLKRSPLGKIPFIETEHGNLSESQVILEYLEETYPEIPLYPADSFERAKCRELIQHLELNVEAHARRLYKEAIFGGTVSDETKVEAKERLEIGLTGLARLAKFSPYIAGDNYSAADSVAWVHFFLISLATQKIYGTDMVAAHLPNVATYIQLLESRPVVQKVAAERAIAIEAFFKK
jgi:glutathione S-transferase